MYSGTPLDIKKLQFFFILYQHRTAYSSAIKFTRLISGNVFVQAEGMLNEAYENFSIDLAPCRKNPIKNKIVIPSCQPLLLGENYTEIKAWQLKFP